MRWLTTPTESCPRHVLLFGSGTVGSGIWDALRSRGVALTRDIAFPWTDSDARDRVLAELGREISDRSDSGSIDIIWAAGKAGFSATDEQVDNELASFADVIKFVESGHAGSTSLIALHLISSAGGLFEGLAVTATDQEPAPLRPYGHLKLEQERLALALPRDIDVQIYRPSSVFGPPRAGSRMGLIPTLLANGVARRPTRLVGAADTLRDYVTGTDVGGFVAAQVLSRRNGRAIHLLASGEPASLQQVVRIVERTLRRRLLVSIAESWNARDMTFGPAAISPRFEALPLATSIALVHSAMVGKPTVLRQAAG